MKQKKRLLFIIKVALIGALVYLTKLYPTIRMMTFIAKQPYMISV